MGSPAMRVLVCPTAFKESMDVQQVLEAMVTGVRRVRPSAAVTAMPVSDGGPGLLQCLQQAGGGRMQELRVSGPIGAEVSARVLWPDEGVVVIEAAEACGLHLVPPDLRDPLRTASLGVGQLVAASVGHGADTVWIGLGGSGSVDGGTGMATALGYRFVDAQDRDLVPGGGELTRLHRIRGGRRPPAQVTALADVRSPLLGPDGAAHRFGPQKGAGPAGVERLERGLARLAMRMELDLEASVADLPGSGAAGGLGAGCVAFLGGDLRDGAAWVLEQTGFDEGLTEADLVVTGEGEYDHTSSLGKVVHEIVRRATCAGVPVILACGRVRGSVPEGVRPVDGGGRWLTAGGLARLVETAAG